MVVIGHNIFEEIKFENEFNKPVDTYFRKILVDIEKLNIEQKRIAHSMYSTLRQLQGYINEFQNLPKEVQTKFLEWIYAIYETYEEVGRQK